ncbi:MULTISPECIES: PIN domain nuclease [unclassified Streptomyces]|uniref:PIN domain nuclease n=1 Tax=unclassified Streptomyces TaxID=2593676 RepID=UPI00017FE9B9|nr:PIN domain nuclease [Streptomyces sp. SPB074]EDY43962.1 PIN family toxin-antitoxin system, toxin component [Streptomyces sp. SPB074]
MINYLIDTSAVVRFFKSPDLFPAWKDCIVRGEVGIIPPIEFEICYSAQKARDRDELLQKLGLLFSAVTPTPAAYDAGRDMQEALTKHGAHRSCGPVDLLLAGTAHVESLTVLHVDKDYVTLARLWPSFRQVRLDTELPL